MTLQELYANINAKKYDSKLPYPAYRPDAKDRATRKEEDARMKAAYDADDRRLEQLFKADLRSYAESKLRQVTDKRFEAIWIRAWDKGHSGGYSEILNEASDLISVVAEFQSNIG